MSDAASTLVIQCCVVCPFKAEKWAADPRCDHPDGRERTIPDEHFENHTAPSWCPLRARPLTIRLYEG